MVRYADARYIRWMRYILFTQNAIKCHNNREILPSFEGRWREKSRFFVTEGSLLRSNISTIGGITILFCLNISKQKDMSIEAYASKTLRTRVKNYPPFRSF